MRIGWAVQVSGSDILPTRSLEALYLGGRPTDFCAMCRKCVRACPVGAIHQQPIRLENGRVQCIDTSTCLDYFAANHGCAICADVCPFSQKGFDAIQARFRGNPEAPRFSIDAHA